MFKPNAPRMQTASKENIPSNDDIDNFWNHKLGPLVASFDQRGNFYKDSYIKIVTAIVEWKSIFKLNSTIIDTFNFYLDYLRADIANDFKDPDKANFEIEFKTLKKIIMDILSKGVDKYNLNYARNFDYNDVPLGVTKGPRGTGRNISSRFPVEGIADNENLEAANDVVSETLEASARSLISFIINPHGILPYARKAFTEALNKYKFQFGAYPDPNLIMQLYRSTPRVDLNDKEIELRMLRTIIICYNNAHQQELESLSLKDEKLIRELEANKFDDLSIGAIANLEGEVPVELRDKYASVKELIKSIETMSSVVVLNHNHYLSEEFLHADDARAKGLRVGFKGLFRVIFRSFGAYPNIVYMYNIIYNGILDSARSLDEGRKMGVWHNANDIATRVTYIAYQALNEVKLEQENGRTE